MCKLVLPKKHFAGSMLAPPRLAPGRQNGSRQRKKSHRQNRGARVCWGPGNTATGALFTKHPFGDMVYHGTLAPHCCSWLPASCYGARQFGRPIARRAPVSPDANQTQHRKNNHICSKRGEYCSCHRVPRVSSRACRRVSGAITMRLASLIGCKSLPPAIKNEPATLPTSFSRRCRALIPSQPETKRQIAEICLFEAAKDA